jgi:hypothetical protein
MICTIVVATGSSSVSAGGFVADDVVVLAPALVPLPLPILPVTAGTGLAATDPMLPDTGGDLGGDREGG